MVRVARSSQMAEQAAKTADMQSSLLAGASRMTCAVSCRHSSHLCCLGDCLYEMLTCVPLAIPSFDITRHHIEQIVGEFGHVDARESFAECLDKMDLDFSLADYGKHVAYCLRPHGALTIMCHI